MDCPLSTVMLRRTGGNGAEARAPLRMPATLAQGIALETGVEYPANLSLEGWPKGSWGKESTELYRTAELVYSSLYVKGAYDKNPSAIAGQSRGTSESARPGSCWLCSELDRARRGVFPGQNPAAIRIRGSSGSVSTRRSIGHEQPCEGDIKAGLALQP